MKVRSVCLLLLIAVLGFSLIGCSCARQAMKGEVAPPKAPEEKKIAAAEEKKEVAAVEERAMPVMPQPAAPPPAGAVVLNPVFFDFDRYNIRPGDAEILKSNLEWFKANPNKKVRIEGNCDERGTVEYNMALGQKRADAAKNYLVNLGVNAKLLETISYGKERPLDPGHNEAAWAKNRRADLVPLP